MLDEAKNINKSLSALGNVIAALADGQVTLSVMIIFINCIEHTYFSGVLVVTVYSLFNKLINFIVVLALKFAYEKYHLLLY